MRANTFRAKGLAIDGSRVATVWGGGPLRYGQAGKIVGRDLGAMTLEVEFADGGRAKFDFRHVALGDNSYAHIPREE